MIGKSDSCGPFKKDDKMFNILFLGLQLARRWVAGEE